MIIVKLMGGLGNQMFQYAFGRSLALKRKVDLKLDVSALSDRSIKGDYSIRDFGLNIFNIKTAIASKEESGKFKKIRLGN